MNDLGSSLRQLTHWERDFLDASLIQQVEDVDLASEVGPGDDVREYVGSRSERDASPLHWGALMGKDRVMLPCTHCCQTCPVMYTTYVLHLRLHWQRQ